MRKLMLLSLCLLLVVSGSVFAQDATEEPMEPEPWVCPEGFEGQTISVFNWSTYIADNTMDDFAELCGVTYEYSLYDSDGAMLARIRQGNPGYDIVVPSGSIVANMIRDGLLIPLDHEMIPNMANLSEGLLDQPYDPGNIYSVPYQWGTIGLGYNTEKLPDGITTWQEMFEYDGPVAWLEDPRAMMGTGLMLLGYDPNTEDPDEIEAARDFLLENSSNVTYIAGDDGQVTLERGEHDIVVEYSGDIIDLTYECECDTFAYVIPDEGANIWTDNLAIPIDAPNPELAMVFIDYILHPQVSADISNYTAYGSPNQAAIDMGLIDEELLSDPAIYPDDELRERLFSVREVSPEAEELYSNAWDELRILMGS